MKIRPVGTELFRVDRQTDMTQLTAAFRNFANMPKNKQNRKPPSTKLCNNDAFSRNLQNQ